MEINKTIQQKFLNSLLEGNRNQCSILVKKLIDKKVPIIIIYEEIIKKSMYQIGELWEHNKISVATEHLASAIAEAILNEHYLQIISKQKINKTVLVACIENEHHQIGIKMVSDIFEINGWTSYFLGSNTPTSDLIEFAKSVRLDFIAISLSIYFHLPKLEKTIQKIREEFPETPILVGGQAFQHGGRNCLLKYHNVIFQPDLNSTDLLIKKINYNG